MRIVNFPETGNNQLGANGICPHCESQSYFHPVANYIETVPGTGQRGVSAAKCQGCKGYVLVVGLRTTTGGLFALEHVFPLDKPKDAVDENVPPPIADDFREALRCHWVQAYKGCVVMCRRAIQASALTLGAPKNKKIVDQIDWLFEKGKITDSLRDFAHEVRLTGNVGAHPDKELGDVGIDGLNSPETDALDEVMQKDADDIIEFTEEYLHHVYVMPAKLRARRSLTAQARSAL